MELDEAAGERRHPNGHRGALIDLHCHLDLYPNHAAAVEAAEQSGVRTLAVTTTPRAWPRNLELSSHTRFVRPALGLHPQLAAERATEIDVFEKYLPEARYVGEVGLDAGPRFYRTLGVQTGIFTRILQACACEGGKILSVHSIRASTPVLDLVESHCPPPRGGIVLHWFTGTASEARRAVELGCYFSVNAAMLRSERHRALVAALPLDRLLTETDGPFTSIDARPSQPADVAVTVTQLASVRGLAVSALIETIHRNLRVLLHEVAPPSRHPKQS